MSVPKPGWLLVAAALGILGGFTFVGRATSDQSKPAVAAVPVVLPGVEGTASCSGRGCHGAVGQRDAARAPTDPHGREYTIWLLGDPHVKAHAVLFQERSQVMVKNLFPKDPHVRAETTVLCLKCHGPAASAGQSPRVANGFGCESCHGAAEKWLGPHTDPTIWDKKNDQAKFTEYGFRPMKTPQDCAKVCVECHVGGPGQEVNHDLYAAGHPRITFELQSYHAQLPRHWPEGPVDKEPLRTWLVGQAASTEASLKLLAHRATDQGKSPWPEFAESDCYACHHALKDDLNDRQSSGYLGKRMPGTLPWNQWYTALPRALAGNKGFVGDKFREDLDALRTQLEKPRPDRAAVAERASKAAEQLHQFLNGLPSQGLELASPSSLFVPEKAAGLWFRDDKDLSVADWDIAAQLTDALNAEFADRPGKKQALEPLYKLLEFSRDGQFDSPTAFDRRAFAKQWLEAVKLLGPAK